jgi:hypothetical protein
MDIFHGFHMDSIWNMCIPYESSIYHMIIPYGFHNHSMWNPYGMIMEYFIRGALGPYLIIFNNKIILFVTYIFIKFNTFFLIHLCYTYIIYIYLPIAQTTRLASFGPIIVVATFRKHLIISKQE